MFLLSINHLTDIILVTSYEEDSKRHLCSFSFIITEGFMSSSDRIKVAALLWASSYFTSERRTSEGATLKQQTGAEFRLLFTSTNISISNPFHIHWLDSSSLVRLHKLEKCLQGECQQRTDVFFFPSEELYQRLPADTPGFKQTAFQWHAGRRLWSAPRPYPRCPACNLTSHPLPVQRPVPQCSGPQR